MRAKRFLPVIAGLLSVMLVVPAMGQTIAYVNFLQFDLQSYRSQATAGLFLDDVDTFGWAARLDEIDGRRLYTNFSNLSSPARLGDNLLTYSVGHVGRLLQRDGGTTPRRSIRGATSSGGRDVTTTTPSGRSRPSTSATAPSSCSRTSRTA